MFSFRRFPGAFLDDDPLDTWEPFLRGDDPTATSVPAPADPSVNRLCPTTATAPVPPSQADPGHLAVG
jgi:hypothetical protein